MRPDDRVAVALPGRGFSPVAKSRARGDDLRLSPIFQTHCTDDANIRLEAPVSLYREVASVLQRGRTCRKSMIKSAMIL
jgi:hypothetical protein